MIGKIYETVCYGCSACKAVCPKKAITMVENNKGFLEPRVSDVCISCGKCMQVCHASISFHLVKYAYIGKLNNPKAQMASQSGGAFTAIAHAVLRKGGVVYGAALDQKFEAHHIRITDLSGLEKLKGSKYVQSRMDLVYDTLANDLLADRIVLFSGTPCQVKGVYQALGQRLISTDKLYTIDLICHGVPSVFLWRDLLQYYEKERHSIIKDVVFRSKAAGKWGSHISAFKFESGKVTFSEYHKSLFYNNLALRDSCYTCQYARKERLGDFTIGDAWGIKEKNPEFYDEKGVSLILINTEKARTFFADTAHEMNVKEVQFVDYCQEALIKPSAPHRDKGEFWRDYQTKSFPYIIRKYAKNNVFLNWRYVFKKIRSKLHV